MLNNKERARYTVLNDKHEVVTCDMMTWAALSEVFSNRIVKQDRIGDVKISTVFLGLNHAFDDGPPLWFETMIFGGEHDQYQERYTTWDEAERGHAEAVEMVRASHPEKQP